MQYIFVSVSSEGIEYAGNDPLSAVMSAQNVEAERDFTYVEAWTDGKLLGKFENGVFLTAEEVEADV